MSGLTAAPYKLTDSEIASVLSPVTVGSAVAALSYDAVGSSILALTSSDYLSPGTSVSGASLREFGIQTNTTQTLSGIYWTATPLSGTWIVCGISPGNAGNSKYGSTVFKRIA